MQRPPDVVLPLTITRIVRLLAALGGLGLVVWASAEDSLIGGGPGFGWTQRAVLLLGLLLGASCFGPAGWCARLLALIVSSGATLVVGELSLRHFLAPRYYRAFEFDPRALYRLVPGAVREHRVSAENGGRRTLYEVNSAGFRGEELDASHRAPRIAVYGDSFIQAEYSALPNSLTERLERHAAERLGAPVEVVNAGVAGYGPDQILRKMEGELASLQPELVLVALFAGNDFGDLLRNKLYRLDSDGVLRENALVLDPWLKRGMEIAREEPILRVVLRQAADFFRPSGNGATPPEAMTPRERMDFFLEQHRSEYREYVVEGDSVVREMHWDSYDADMSLTPASEEARYKIELMNRIVAEIGRTAQQAGTPLVLVLIPHPIDLCGHSHGEVDRAKYPDYDPRAMTNAFERIARQHEIPYLNLFGPFHERCADELFLRGLDDHWNDRGQDFAAEWMAEFLASNGLLHEAARVFALRRGSG